MRRVTLQGVIETGDTPMNATFTPEEAHLIWEALRYSDSYNSPEAQDRHSEALRLVAHELRLIGVFPPLSKHPSDTVAA